LNFASAKVNLFYIMRIASQLLQKMLLSNVVLIYGLP
jgi:hypothetical protein